MKKHSLWMMALCVLPMLLIFILPALGVGNSSFLVLLPLLCVGSHLLMMKGHLHDHAHQRQSEQHLKAKIDHTVLD